jgi:hypothetical protein
MTIDVESDMVRLAREIDNEIERLGQVCLELERPGRVEGAGRYDDRAPSPGCAS